MWVVYGFLSCPEVCVVRIHTLVVTFDLFQYNPQIRSRALCWVDETKTKKQNFLDLALPESWDAQKIKTLDPTAAMMQLNTEICYDDII